MWFNDQYHPESDLFQSAFSSRERAIVAAFHQRFESVSDSFPDPLGRAADLQARPEWRALSRAAMDTLRDLGEDST